MDLTKIIAHIKKTIDILMAPFFIGTYVTIAFLYLAWIYYDNNSSLAGMNDATSNPVLQVFQKLSETSIDLRLRQRGPRFGSPQVALLTVDEKAVTTVGRWPWPRETLANAVEQAIKLGAKVIAFDMIFSEASQNLAKDFSQRLQAKGDLSPATIKLLNKELMPFDSDRIFSEMVERNAGKFVMGSFYESSRPIMTNSSYPNSCHKMIFENSPEFSIWDNEEILLGLSDSFEILLPDQLEEVYKDALKTIRTTKESNTKGKLTSLAHRRLEHEIRIEQLKYCLQDWLVPENDPSFDMISGLWDDLKKSDEDLTQNSFEEWSSNFKNLYSINAVPVADNWVMNTKVIAKSTLHTGFFNAFLDSDGTIRRSQLVTRTGAFYMPSIALKSYLLANGYNATVHLEPSSVRLGVKEISKLTVTDNDTGDDVFDIPVDGAGRMIINYAGERQMFSYVSLAELLTESDTMEIEQKILNPENGLYEHAQEPIMVNKIEYMKDKIMVLGATATGIYDLRVTPFDENFPGAETHANVIDNIVRRDFLKNPKNEEPMMLGVLLLLGLLLSFSLNKLGALSGLLLTGSLLGTILLVDNLLLFGQGLVVSTIFPLTLIITIYVTLTSYKYFSEEKNKKELRTTFSKYVSPAIVDEVLNDPSGIELGGRKENITVFFSDIRGFTTISEKLDPQALGDLLNSYLTPMTDLVFENKGTLDKYMGDAVMAFFGAPISYDDHPKYAARCALQQLVKLDELQIEYEKQGLPNIDIGIGLNTGDCSVGNMGSETVRSYTVMGDAVNLGARLEGINKQYGTRIIISEFTYSHIKDDFLCREVDLVRVKGKLVPVHIFELVSEGPSDEVTNDLIKEFNLGYKAYHGKQFEDSINHFSNCLNLKPTDACSKLYMERCQNFIDEPPPADWDGVFVMTTK